MRRRATLVTFVMAGYNVRVHGRSMHSRAATLTSLRPHGFSATRKTADVQTWMCLCVVAHTEPVSARVGGTGVSHARKDFSHLMGAELAHAHVHVGARQPTPTSTKLAHFPSAFGQNTFLCSQVTACQACCGHGCSSVRA
jgi:hypothetical protein